MMPPAIPIATYRVQLTPNFDFDAATVIVPYLKALGITHLYASPFMKARKGSTHGYDIVDHTRINPELGGDAGFERLSNTPTIHGGSTCWNGVRPRHTRCRSTSTGTYCPIERAAVCCCRSSARPMDRRWKMARSNFATIAMREVFRPGISNTGCR